MGTGRWAATRPLLLTCVLAALAGCSCDDRLIDLSFATRDAKVPRVDERPIPDPIQQMELGFFAFATGNAGCDDAPLSISVQVIGGRPPYHYRWDPHPDLSALDVASPVATGTGTREYSVTVLDADGLEYRTSATVTRTALPTPAIDFTAGDDLVCDGEQVALDGSASHSADGSPLASLSWDLQGDGIPDSSDPALPPFAPVDGQRVRLTATDENGCSASREVVLAVRPLPRPVLRFEEGDERVCSGRAVSLDASGSVDADGHPIGNFRWDLDGDGLVDSVAPSTGPLVPEASTAVALSVVDGLGCSATVVQPVEVLERPVAAITFASGGDRLCAGDTFAVDGSSSRDAAGAPVARYAWDLDGDPGTVESIEAAPPALPGVASGTVRLTVFDENGCDASAEVPVAVRPLPRAEIAFLAGDPLTCAGDEVALSGAGSRDADGQPVAAFSWDLDGDGAADAFGATPPPFAPGSDTTVGLVVTDLHGCSAASAQPLRIRALPTPRIAFTEGSDRVCSGETVGLDASASRDADGLPVARYQWDTDGDGQTDRTTALTGAFSPGGAGATLVVEDSHGCRASLVQPLAVGLRPTAVIAFAAGGEALCRGDEVALDGSASRTASGGTGLSFAWDLDGNPATVESTATAPPPFAPGASQAVRLTVTDAAGCSASAVRSLDVRPPPTPAISFLQGGATTCAGDAVELDASGSRDAHGRPVTGVSWDLDGDDITDVFTPTTGPFPAADGAARLTVADDRGCTATATQPLAARARPTVALAFTRGAARTCAGTPVALDASASRAEDGGYLAFAWDLDGNGSTDAAGPTAGPFVPGDGQTLRLTVRDALGCTAEATESFSTFAPPTAVIDVAGPGKLCDGDLTRFDGSRSRDAGAAPVASYAWDLNGDGAPDETAAMTPLYAPTGPVSLTVTDGNACTATATAGVPVLGPRQLYPFGEEAGSGNNVVDIIFVIDNSGSMGDEITAVEDNINVNFADIIQASRIDYRIILISRHGQNRDESICVRAPLSGTSCNPRPNRPVNTSRFFHYDVEVGSWNSLELILDTYRQRDRNNFAPNGWSGWLRPGSRKVFVEITDDESTTLSANAFEAGLYQLSTAHFGTPEEPNWVFHSIVGLARNAPPTAPWLPSDPIQTRLCGNGAMAAGIQYQELSRRSGGLRFPICEYGSFDTVFEAIAEEVIEPRVSCELGLPAAGSPDPDTLEVEHTPGSGGIVVYTRVPNAGACTADGFYLDGATVRLCPEACTAVRTDPGDGVALSGCGP